jgi:hypothetical protein
LEVHPEGFVTGWQRLTEAAQAQALVHEPGKISALEAAIKVLEESESPLTANQLIEAMTIKGYWSSGSRAPARSLYSAIQREIHGTGANSRFLMVGRSKFALVNPRHEKD